MPTWIPRFIGRKSFGKSTWFQQTFGLGHLNSETSDDKHQLDCPIVMLPVEVISYVFELCVLINSEKDNHQTSPTPSEEGYNSPIFGSEVLKLGATCRLWREIAWSTPRLWTHVRICLDTDRSPLRVKFIRDWVNRSSILPITIHLTQHPTQSHKQEYRIPIKRYYALLNILAVNSARWKAINLEMSLPLMKYVCRAAHHFPLLQHISLQIPDGEQINVPFQLWDACIPHPRFVAVKNLHYDQVGIDWQAITSMNASGMTIQDCIQIIKWSPMLQELSISGITAHENTNINSSMTNSSTRFSDVAHQRLESLSFHMTSFASNGDAFFRRIICPRLKSLKIHILANIELDSGVPYFFHRSKFPLQTLSISGAPLNYDVLRILLAWESKITYLKLGPFLKYNDNSPYNEQFLVSFLITDLAQTAVVFNPDPIHNRGLDFGFLPHLERLDIDKMDYYIFPWVQIPRIVGLPSEYNSPRRRPLKTFKITNIRKKQFTEILPENMIPIMLKLRHAGIDFISDNRHYDIIDWSMKYWGMT